MHAFRDAVGRRLAEEAGRFEIGPIAAVTIVVSLLYRAELADAATRWPAQVAVGFAVAFLAVITLSLSTLSSPSDDDSSDDDTRASLERASWHAATAPPKRGRQRRSRTNRA